MRPNTFADADRAKIGDVTFRHATSIQGTYPGPASTGRSGQLCAFVLTGLLAAIPGAAGAASVNIAFALEDSSTTITVPEERPDDMEINTVSIGVYLAEFDPPAEGCTVQGTVSLAEGGTATPGEDFQFDGGQFSIDVAPAADEGETAPASAVSAQGEGPHPYDVLHARILDDDVHEGIEEFRVEITEIQDNCDFDGDVFSYYSTGTIRIDDSADYGGTPEPPPENTALADDPSLNDNQRSVAQSLDAACEALSGREGVSREQQDLLDACAMAQASANRGAVMDALSASNAFAMGDMGLRNAEVRTHSLMRQISQRRNNRRSVDFSGVTLSSNGQTLPGGQLLNAAGAGDDIADFGRWGLFFGGTLELGNRADSEREQGYDVNLHNLTTGVDYRFDNGFVAGSALGYTLADVDMDNGRGQVEQRSASLSAFASYYAADQYYLDLMLSYGGTRYETEREVTIGGLDQTAEASPDGHEYTASLDGGYYLNFGNRFLRFFGGARYINARIEDYNEDASSTGAGAGSLLHVEEQDIESATAHAGVELGGNLNTRFAVLVPQVSVDWEHQFVEDTRTVSGRFLADPTSTSFTWEGDTSPDRSYGHASASLNAVFPNGVSAYVNYRTTFAREDYGFQDISLGARLEF